MKKLLVGIFVLLSFNTFAIDGNEVLGKYINNKNVDTRIMLEMKFMDGSGGTIGSRIVEQWKMKDEDGNMKMTLASHRPVAVKGERMLVAQNTNRGNDVWIYSPQERKIKRLSAEDISVSFLGSPDGTITNEDRELMNIDDYNAKLLKEESVSGENCYVIEISKKNQKSSQYDKRVLWIVKDKWEIIKMEAYMGGKKVKEELKKELEEVNGVWFAKTGMFKNLENGNKVIYRMPKALFNDAAKVDKKRFTQRYLETGTAN